MATLGGFGGPLPTKRNLPGREEPGGSRCNVTAGVLELWRWWLSIASWPRSLGRIFYGVIGRNLEQRCRRFGPLGVCQRVGRLPHAWIIPFCQNQNLQVRRVPRLIGGNN